MEKAKIKIEKRDRRRSRIRAKVKGVITRPRLSVYKSNRNIYLQLIDDEAGKTIVSAHSDEIDAKKIKSKNDKFKPDFELGKLIAQKAIAKKIKQVVFDRGGYKYHGKIKAAAEGAREAGLEF